MSRVPRIVAAGFPHHIVQRGNRRQHTFFCEQDYFNYLEIMAERCGRYGVEIWAYCLMPNHVHLIAVPGTSSGLHKAIGEAHKKYTEKINHREGWRGHLWQGRFSSYVLDEAYLLVAVRYIELNPIKGKIVDSPEKYPWSSASAHKAGRDDRLVKVQPILSRIDSWQDYIRVPVPQKALRDLKRHERTGRPLGSIGFILNLEQPLVRKITVIKTTGLESNL